MQGGTKIVTELRKLKGLECQLAHKGAGAPSCATMRLTAPRRGRLTQKIGRSQILGVAFPRIRASFLQSVMALEKKASGLERLIDALRETRIQAPRRPSKTEREIRYQVRID